MFLFRSFVVIGFLIVNTSSAPLAVARQQQPGGTPAVERLIDRYLAAYVAGNHFSGTVLMARGDEILVNKGYGMSAFEHDTPNTDKTRYQIGSVSKSFTAAAIFQLLRRGELELDDPLSRFIPEFPRGSEITIRDLLSHTSGLTRIVFLSDFGDRSHRQNTTEDLVEWLLDKPFVSQPGEKYNYSNANYSILANIIERQSGLLYGAYIRQHLLNPLSLMDTGHRETRSEIVRNLASSYVPAGIGELQHSRYFDYSVFTGSGSLYSTTSDLFHWSRALHQGNAISDILPDESAADPEKLSTYAWNQERRLGREALVMRGWDGVGFSANLTYFPDEDMTVIALSNLNISAITAEIVDVVARTGFGESVDQLHILDEPDIDGDSLSDYAGVYRFGPEFYVPNSSIQIVEKGGQLLIPANAFGPEGGLLPIAENSFIHRQQWIRVIFERDQDGEISGMRYGEFKTVRESAPVIGGASTPGD